MAAPTALPLAAFRLEPRRAFEPAGRAEASLGQHGGVLLKRVEATSTRHVEQPNGPEVRLRVVVLVADFQPAPQSDGRSRRSCTCRPDP